MLLERESPLASLTEYAAEARCGDGRLVLLSGEAGAGKSALVERLEEDLPDARWSWGACDGLFTPRPLGPLFDLAEKLGGELGERCRARAHRDELFDALLRAVNEPGQLHVLVMEDMHWADEATVDLLRFLGRRLRDASVLLIATFRDDALTVKDPLRVALGELATQRSARRIGLAPLSADAVARLAAGSGVDPAELHRLTGGNPFYVTEVLRGGLDKVPASARDAVLTRTARLSEPARDLLGAAALIGTRSELSLLESVAASGVATVDEVLDSGLLAEDGGALRFRHEIARLAVEQSVPAHRRSAIHARVLDALRRSGAEDDARMAFHAEAAGDGEATVAYASRAARRSAELGAHREAVAQYERALRFAAGDDDATQATLHQEYAVAVSVLDRWEDAAAAGERALKLWRGVGDQRRQSETLRQLSRTMWRLCRRDDALAAAEQAVDVLEPLGPGPELAWAYANLANQLSLDRNSEVARELIERAMRMAEELAMPALLSDSLNTLATVVGAAGGDSVVLLRRALDIALAGNLNPQAGRTFTNLYAALVTARRLDEADACYTQGLAYCERGDMWTYATCLQGERTNVLAKAGAWEDSAALAGELLGRVASPINRLNPLASLGSVRARRGDEGAWECLDEAAVGADGSGEPEWIWTVRLARAEAYWLAGRDAEAAREVETVLDAYDWKNPWERGAIASWLRRTGSNRTLDGDLAEPYRLMIAGAAAAAAAVWTDLGCPYDAALARYDGGDEESLREALRLFDKLGAAAAARLTRRRMRGLGIQSIPTGAHTTTRAHPLGLTRREHEVLDLICNGHTNAEIAARLFISAKTVDHHVSAVLAKLGAPSRSVAAAEAIRLGLVGAPGA